MASSVSIEGNHNTLQIVFYIVYFRPDRVGKFSLQYDFT